MRSVNIDQLRALVAVTELGSFTAAARRLNLTQPAISLQIRELESRYGVQLLERMGKKAFPTSAGLDLVEHAHRLVTEEGQADLAMRRFRDGQSGRVRIGMSTTTLNYFMSDALRSLRRDAPDILLRVAIGTTRETLDQLADNRLDLGIVNLPVQDEMFSTVTLMTEPLVAILPVGEQRPPAVVTPAYFADHALILERRPAALKTATLRWLTEAHEMPDPAMEVEHLEAIKGAVAAGLGGAIVPRMLMRDSRVEKQVYICSLQPILERTIALVQRRDKPQTPSFDRVRNVILSLAESD